MTEFSLKFDRMVQQLWHAGEEVEVGEWQSQDVRDKPHMVSRELTHVRFIHTIAHSVKGLQHDISPNLPWAEDHFLERVSGIPYNPPPSEAWWPYAVAGNAEHKDGEKFSHTYPERMWPKMANVGETRPNRRQVFVPHNGIRYEYGDLEDLVEQLVKNPQTRQAYLPIWFPEDTGAVAGQRVPCTLGYHFLIRNHHLDIVYYIRSCDLLRHFTDDVYMACRLAQFVAGKLTERRHPDIRVNQLVMYISSLHIFRGDYERIEMMIARSAMDGPSTRLLDERNWATGLEGDEGYEEEIRGAAI